MLGALIADGWYSGFVGFDAKRAGAHYGAAPELLAQLVLWFADGTDQWIVTDNQWQAQFGAIRHADLLMGNATTSPWSRQAGIRPASTRPAGAASRCRPRDGGRSLPIPGRPSG